FGIELFIFYTFSIFGLILLSLKLDHYIPSLKWSISFIPLYISFLKLPITLLILPIQSRYSDQFKLDMYFSIFNAFQLITIIFIIASGILIGLKLDSVNISWIHSFIPIWIGHGIIFSIGV